MTGGHTLVCRSAVHWHRSVGVQNQGAARHTLGSLQQLVHFCALLCGCRAVKTPFTGRLARLPPRIVEYLFHSGEAIVA